VNWNPGYGEGAYTFVNGVWIPSSTPETFRNKSAVINGDFAVWIESATFPAILGNTYFAEMWKYHKNGTMVHGVHRSDLAPSVAQAGRRIPYSLLVDCTTIDSSIGPTDYALIQHYIEGYRWNKFANKESVLSFWAMATKPGIYSFGISNAGADRSAVFEYEVKAPNTYEFKSIVIPPSPDTGTWNYTNGVGATLTFALACGSTYQLAPGSWQNGQFFASPNQINACDDTANDFRITGVRLGIGNQPSFHDTQDYGETIREIERYYLFRKFSVVGSTLGYTANVSAGSNYHISVAFPQLMRATPTMTWDEWTSSNFPATAANFQSVGIGGFNVFKQASGTGVGYFLGGFIADARF
jgi:hypothetical protein